MTAALLFAALLWGSAPLAGSVASGESIFRSGQSARGAPIDATVGPGDTVPATLLPCINCHGADGRGRSEGGVRPADIRPSVLARPLRDERRERPAYDAARLRRAITMGFDVAGRPLDTAMPRYGLSQADADDLLAYLAVLEQRQEPGVSSDHLRIGVIGAALTPPLAPVYGRRIEIVSRRDDDLLLLIDASADGSASLAAARSDGLPTIVFAAADAAPGESGFVITASAADQERVLASVAAADDTALLLRQDCSAALTATAARTLLMRDSVAARCALEQLPWPAGQRIRIALAAPPDAVVRAQVAEAGLGLVVELLQQAGHELTRERLLAQLQRVQQRRLGPLPPISWTAQRRHGLDQVWMLGLARKDGRLQPEPGWLAVP
ncbi:cytochrome c [Tahibacter aquaticus]|uniref:Cytochrome c n=1 Tax=Tahibacter aquaticus TaxID=520092 RepID=A0A4R6YNV9_9GAMM|nr:cytochrome c [Tahibacter aquaticus]TDR39328.1 cytochrome c [Tahibacter aquaticus]